MTSEVPMATSSYSAYNDKSFAEYVQQNLQSASSNEEFYAKLLELKNEQRKTLEFMQELYNQKKHLKQEILKSELVLNDLANASIDNSSSNFNRNTVSAYEDPINLISFKSNDDHKYERENDKEAKEIIYASKPPLPLKPSLKQSIDKDKLENELSDNLKKIEKIWENFNLEDYENISKIVGEKLDRQKPPKIETKSSTSESKSWANRVTIVEPFNMTLREQVKSSYKEKVEREIEAERLAKLQAELDECNKKFKAQPIPAHVFLPLFEEKQREEELRKLRLKLASKEYHEKVSKPFNLTNDKKNNSYDKNDTNENTNFVANPLPDFYFSDDNHIEKAKEQELYRQIRNQIRAYETLKESKLPRNMELFEEKRRLEIEREIERENFIKEQMELASKFKVKNEKLAKSSKLSTSIPNYDELYKKFATELEQRKAESQKKTTICKPFKFSSTNKNKLRKVTSATNSRPQSSTFKRPSSASSMQRLNRSLSASVDAMPIKSTESHLLRESVTRKKIDQIALNEMKREHIEKMKKIKSKNIHNQMQTRITSSNEVGKSIERKTREYRLQKQKEEIEYEEKLEEMKKKVESQKFLFERVAEENARRAAEKKLKETLKNAGLPDDILNDEKKVAKSVRKSYNTSDDWINE